MWRWDVPEIAKICWTLSKFYPKYLWFNFSGHGVYIWQTSTNFCNIYHVSVRECAPLVRFLAHPVETLYQVHSTLTFCTQNSVSAWSSSAASCEYLDILVQTSCSARYTGRPIHLHLTSRWDCLLGLQSVVSVAITSLHEENAVRQNVGRSRCSVLLLRLVRQISCVVWIVGLVFVPNHPPGAALSVSDRLSVSLCSCSRTLISSDLFVNDATNDATRCVYTVSTCLMWRELGLFREFCSKFQTLSSSSKKILLWRSVNIWQTPSDYGGYGVKEVLGGWRRVHGLVTWQPMHYKRWRSWGQISWPWHKNEIRHELSK